MQTRHFGTGAHAATEVRKAQHRGRVVGDVVFRGLYLQLYSQAGHGRGPYTQAPP